MKTDIKEISEFPLVLTVEDVAKIMGIGRVAAYNLAHSQGFPCKFVGRSLKIPRDAFFNWLNSFKHLSSIELQELSEVSSAG